MTINIEEVLKSILGNQYVTTDTNARITYVRDAGWYEGGVPEIVIRPGSTEEISRVIKVANATKTPITVRSAGSTYTGGALCYTGGILMDMTRLDKILEINEEGNFVKAQCGVNWSRLNYELKKRGLHAGFRGPGSGITATVGGSASVVNMWWGSAKYGCLGDQILGFEVVLPTGDIIRTGSRGNPYAKAFARYGLGPDLSGLFIGDHGIFGVKTEVTLRTYPLPEVVDFFEYGFKNEVDSHEAASEMAKRNTHAADMDFPDEDYSAGLRRRYTYMGDAKAIIAGDIWADSQKEAEGQKEIFDRIAKEHNGWEMEIGWSKFLFTHMFDALFWGRRDAGILMGIAYQSPIKDLLAQIARLREYRQKHKDIFNKCFNYRGVLSFLVSRYGDSVMTLYLPWEYDDKPDVKADAVRIWEDVARIGFEMGGVPYWMGKLLADIIFTKVSPIYHGTLKTLKTALDPNHILNPGLWYL